MTAAGRIWRVFAREIRAARRSRTYLALALVITVTLFGVAIAGGGPTGGYVPTVIDVLVVVEVLVPAIAFAVGYRSMADPIERGELDVIETYPIPAWKYISGTYGGRAVVLSAVVGVPLAVLGVYVATTAGPETTVFASHRGVDSPWLYLRFLALTLGYGLVSLSIVFLLSVVAGSRARALVLALAGLLALTVGGDIAVFAALEGGTVTTQSLGEVVAVTPAGAYRGLVFDQVLYVAVPSRSSFVPGWLASTALLCWWTATLVATAAIPTLR
jgi:ABC-type transport system involved in multi-copper enzyme maturation permease subunit